MRLQTTVYGLLPAGVFLLDRLLKLYAQDLPEGKAFSFAPGLEFGHFLNPSLFFLPAWQWIPWVALFVFIALLGFWILGLIGHWDLGFGISRHRIVPILLGGGSNVFDRFAYGGVIDYVNILGIATVNLADILIIGGLAGLLLKSRTSRNG